MADDIIVIQEPASEASRYEFRVSAGVLQWRPSAAYAWRNLVDLSAVLEGAVEIPDSDGITEGVVHLFLTADERAKLAGVAEGAEANVQADWAAASGDAQILNKPTLGTAAAEDVSDFAPATHDHVAADITDFEAAVSAIAGGAAVGIGTAQPGEGTQGNFYVRLIDG